MNELRPKEVDRRHVGQWLTGLIAGGLGALVGLGQTSAGKLESEHHVRDKCRGRGGRGGCRSRGDPQCRRRARQRERRRRLACREQARREHRNN